MSTLDQAPPGGNAARSDGGALSPRHPGAPFEVFLAFLRLGLTSFGGPVAHIGYFRAEFVERRRWLDERSYADLVALCQFLPGPASSQVGLALGQLRAGWPGALAAWLGFTLPSALLLMAFAYGIARNSALATSGAVHGLKVFAVAVVAQAVWSMGRSLCPDRPRAGLAILGALLTLVLPATVGQVAAIAVCGLTGWWALRVPHQSAVEHLGYGVSKRAGAVALAVFALLFAGLPIVATTTGASTLALVNGFYRSGALVFGGGHVVLPLLQSVVVPSGAVTNADFLAGYGAAQVMPGPLFAFSAYLGAVNRGPLSGWIGGLVFLVTLFTPAFLLLMGALPYWDALRQRDSVQSIMAGVNAGVVGLLLAALYDPVATSAILTRADFGFVLALFGLLALARWSPVTVAVVAALAGWLLARG